MLTDTALRSQVDQLWDKLWSGGLSNPLDAIEQLSYLLFMKRLDDAENAREQAARRRGTEYEPIFKDAKHRWAYWTNLKAEDALKYVKETVFPALKEMGSAGSSFELQMKEAEFKINKPSLLIEACKAIDNMKISQQNQDVQGDLYEYLLGKLTTAKIAGQFRTPRHIIRMMVQMIAPHATERICDPAAGTAGFLVNAYQYILEQSTSKEILEYDEDGMPHHLTGDLLTSKEREFLQTKAITGYDNDSGMTLLRIGSMNLMLHGITHPNFRYADTLSKSFNEEKQYDVVLANPPFKGAIDSSDVNPTLPTRYRKTELLFLHLFLRLLEMGGRCAAISPDGVLFGSSKAHVETRRKLVEENRLDAVISMPSGVFKPYAGVSTAVLIFTKGSSTDRIWFYDMEHDGFSLDDKRQRVAENDIPDILECWKHRHDAKFTQKRAQRLADLREHIAPLKKDRLQHHATIHRLKFEEVIATDGTADVARNAREQAEAELAELQSRIAPLEREINQLTRQFWVSKEQVKANKYDLSASRYRQIEQEEIFYEEPAVTLERLQELEVFATREIGALENTLGKS
jgi:type I restriction enzyme M protein